MTETDWLDVDENELAQIRRELDQEALAESMNEVFMENHSNTYTRETDYRRQWSTDPKVTKWLQEMTREKPDTTRKVKYILDGRDESPRRFTGSALFWVMLVSSALLLGYAMVRLGFGV